MQVNSFYSYTPMKIKSSAPNFKADASELNELWEDNPSTSSLWNSLGSDLGYNTGAYFLPPNVKVHSVWDEVNGFKNLKNVHAVKKIYTGYTLLKTPEKIKELKEIYGVKTIVDLVGYKDYKRECEEAGMNYFGDFNLYYNMYSDNAFLSQEEYLKKYKNALPKEELIERHKEITLKFNTNLNNLIDVLDNDYVYMGCDHGNSRTNDVILLINNYTSRFKLSLNEDNINDIEQKKQAIEQFKKNVELYSEK